MWYYKLAFIKYMLFIKLTGELLLMIEKLVDRFMAIMLKNNAISEEEISIYRYGYILLFEQIVNIAVAILIGIIFNKLVYVGTFLLVYIPLRSFCGGWHADKFWKCTLLSNLIILIMVVCSEKICEMININMMLIIIFVLAIIVYVVAPIGTKSKPLSDKEKKFYKPIILIITLVYILISILIGKYLGKEIMFVIMYSYVIQVLVLMIEILKNKIVKTD